MRPFKRICFFLYSCAVFAGGFACSLQMAAFFYPGKEAAGTPRTDSGFLSGPTEEAGTDNLEQTVSDRVRLTASTKMVLRICDLDEGSERQEQTTLPARLIGCSRAQTEQFFEQYRKTASLKEREAGFLNAELLSFSPERIVVRKNYRKYEKPSSFQMVIEQNMVTVYEQETGLLYLRTAVDARLLPPQVRRELLKGCRHVSPDSLEKFLVSYGEA